MCAAYLAVRQHGRNLRWYRRQLTKEQYIPVVTHPHPRVIRKIVARLAKTKVDAEESWRGLGVTICTQHRRAVSASGLACNWERGGGGTLQECTEKLAHRSFGWKPPFRQPNKRMGLISSRDGSCCSLCLSFPLRPAAVLLVLFRPFACRQTPMAHHRFVKDGSK